MGRFANTGNSGSFKRPKILTGLYLRYSFLAAFALLIPFSLVQNAQAAALASLQSGTATIANGSFINNSHYHFGRYHEVFCGVQHQPRVRCPVSAHERLGHLSDDKFYNCNIRSRFDNRDDYNSMVRCVFLQWRLRAAREPDGNGDNHEYHANRRYTGKQLSNCSLS